MKKLFFRILSFSLLISLVLSAVPSCGAKGSTALKYKDLTVSTAIYQYLCCMDKTSYLYEAYHTTSDQTKASQLTDLPAIWAMTDENGKTVAETLKDGVTEKLKWMLYLEQAALDRGYSLTEEDKAGIKNNLNELVKNFETKSEFNKVMKDYGINYDDMYDYYLHQGLASIGNYMLFGENGTFEVTESAAQAYFQKNYVTVGCIFINDQNKSYANGKTVYLPEEEKQAKRALAEDLYQRLLAGEDFTALYQSYSDNRDDEEGDAVTFTRGSFGNETAEDAAFSLSVGKIIKVETDKGIFIFQRRNLNTSYFETEKDNIVSDLEKQKQTELLQDAAFSVNEEFLSSLDIAGLVFVR